MSDTNEEERTPPERIRITKLQEAQLLELEKIERLAAQMHYEVGVSPDDLKPLGEMDLAKLPRSHDVLVAEADHEPAGYLAWKDEAPGIAWIIKLAVDPSFHRFGVATRLLREVGEKASKHGIGFAVAACHPKALWAMSFLGTRGFQLLDAGKLPDKVAQWKNNLAEDALQPGQQLWWRTVDGLGTIPGLPRPS